MNGQDSLLISSIFGECVDEGGPAARSIGWNGLADELVAKLFAEATQNLE
jgi:hypothetical protein